MIAEKLVLFSQWLKYAKSFEMTNKRYKIQSIFKYADTSTIYLVLLILKQMLVFWLQMDIMQGKAIAHNWRKNVIICTVYFALFH